MGQNESTSSKNRKNVRTVIPIINPNKKRHEIIKLLKFTEVDDTLSIELTDEAEVFFETKKRESIKLLVMAGKTGIGKSTLLNFICKQYMYPDYEGSFPQIFKSQDGCSSITILFDLLLNPIEIKKEKYFLVDAEGFDGVFEENTHSKRKELTDKVFALIYSFSDIFIINYDLRLVKNQKIILHNLKEESKKMFELECGKDSIFKDNFILNETIFFFRNKEENFSQKDSDYLVKNGYKVFYPIKEIPPKFRNEYSYENSITIIDCKNSVENAFSDIFENNKKNQRKNIFFDFQRFKLHLDNINKGMKLDNESKLYNELTFLYIPTNKHYFYFSNNKNNTERYPEIFTKKSKIFYKEFIFRILLNSTDAIKSNKEKPNVLSDVRNTAYTYYINNDINYPINNEDINDDPSLEKIISTNYIFGDLINIINEVFDKLVKKKKPEYLPFSYSLCYELKINPEFIEENIPESIKNKELGIDFWFYLIIMNCCLFSKDSCNHKKEIEKLSKKFFNWAENWALQNKFIMNDFFLCLRKLKSTLNSMFKESYTLKYEKSENLLSIGTESTNNTERIIIKICEKIFEKLEKKKGNCKIITLAGEPGIGKSTLLNSLIYNSKFRHYNGVYPQIFQTSDSIFSETLGININLTEIEVGEFESVMLIDAEGFGATRENEEIDEDIYLRILEKIYALLMLVSDCFIFFLKNRYEQSNKDFVDKMINICKFLERSQTGNQNIDEINIDNFFIFKKNTEKINEIDESRHWSKFNRNVNDFIFPILEIPKDFRKSYHSSYLKDSAYIKHLNYVFKKITEQVKEKPSKFSLNELKVFIDLINEGNIEFSEIIKFQALMKRIKTESEKKFEKLVKDYPSIINQYNNMVFFEEIIKEVSINIVKEEFENQEEREKFHKSINNENKNSSYNKEISTDTNANTRLSLGFNNIKGEFKEMNLPDFSAIKTQDNIASIRPQNRAIVNDMLSFHNQEIKSFQNVIRTDGHTGTIANLRNGESFLIHKNLNGNVVATDAFNLSNNWKINGKIQNTNTLRVTDMIKNGQQDKYLNNNNITPKEYDVIRFNENYGLNSARYISLSAASGFIGSIIGNIIVGHYKGKSGWSIAGELTIGGGITAGIVAASIKIPIAGLCVSMGILSYQGVKSFINKNVALSSKFENLGKIVTNTAVTVGMSIGFAEAGMAVGVLGGPIGVFCGGLIGGLIGGIGGALASHGINKFWKIVNPEKAMNILDSKLCEYGYWKEIELIFEILKINYKNFLEEKPKFFDEFLNYKDEPYKRLNGDIIWGNVILLNILSMLSCINEGKYSERSEIIAQKVLKFLRCLNMKDFNFDNYQQENMNIEYLNEKLIIKDHINSINKVIGSWMDIAK